MRYIPRNLDNIVRQAARHFPAVVVTGPRRSGKTTLLRQLFPKIHYVLLEDPDIQGRIRSDPRTFLEELRPPLGQLFEGFVAAEILKSQVNQGGRKELYYFRDQQGLEVDFLLPRPNAGLWLIECKAGKTVRPAMAAPLLALRRTMEKRSTRLIVVYGKSRSAQATRAVARGVEAIELERFVESLTAGH